jgi:hypothetical protein
MQKCEFDDSMLTRLSINSKGRSYYLFENKIAMLSVMSIQKLKLPN